MDMDKFNEKYDEAIGQINKGYCLCEHCNRHIINEEDFCIVEPYIICHSCFDIGMAFLDVGICVSYF